MNKGQTGLKYQAQNTRQVNAVTLIEGTQEGRGDANRNHGNLAKLGTNHDSTPPTRDGSRRPKIPKTVQEGAGGNGESAALPTPPKTDWMTAAGSAPPGFVAAAASAPSGQGRGSAAGSTPPGFVAAVASAPTGQGRWSAAGSTPPGFVAAVASAPTGQGRWSAAGSTPPGFVAAVASALTGQGRGSAAGSTPPGFVAAVASAPTGQGWESAAGSTPPGFVAAVASAPTGLGWAWLGLALVSWAWLGVGFLGLAWLGFGFLGLAWLGLADGSWWWRGVQALVAVWSVHSVTHGVWKWSRATMCSLDQGLLEQTQTQTCYGGMLSVYMRIKYPNLVAGALAASAPILSTAGLDDPWQFFRDVTADFENISQECRNAVKGAFHQLKELGERQEYNKIQSTFALCKRPSSAQDIHQLNGFLRNAFTLMAMLDYPYRTQFMGKMPANPVKVGCETMLRGSDLLTSLRDTAAILYNSTGLLTCYDVYSLYVECADPTGCGIGFDSMAWDYQACTEINLCYESNNITDMFPAMTFTEEERLRYCSKRWGVIPRPDWLKIQFWGDVHRENGSVRERILAFPFANESMSELPSCASTDQ
ncbi:dipeptidyl peptidase 2 isoform 3-T3 [Syngnathus typhle]